MPFNVATIKDKAISAKNATVTKIQDTRDRHSSTPMARTRFADAGYLPKGPPPPPPHGPSERGSLDRGRSYDGQSNSYEHGHGPPPVLKSTKPGLAANASATPSSGRSSSTSPPPPPPSRGSSVLQRTRVFNAQPTPTSTPSPTPARTPQRWSPQVPESRDSQAAAETVDIDKIDWTNLSAEDKRVFFGWLDEFFEGYIEKMRAVTLQASEGEGEGEHGNETFAVKVEPPPAPPASNATIITGRGPPPPIRSWSKPAIVTVSPSPSPSDTRVQPQNKFTSSYPPPTTHGSQALDLAYYFHASTKWSSPPWYASPNAIPPPLQTNPHRLYKAQMVTHGDTRSISFAVLFCDVSTAWVTISFSSSTNREMERTARYLPPPEAMGGEELRRESEMYGEAVASFAEGFLGSGQFCARGECWDLASEALKFITSEYSSQGVIPTPVPSLGRTHGHLIYLGKATKGGRQEGMWRGGDDRVRRGDIVEWRSVRIARVGDPPGGWAILGDPEHTAIITRDSVPSYSQVYDGASLEPRVLKSLEVVEQSRNDPPEPVKRTYDLNRFEEGEVWIYRPVAMSTYLGFEELVCEAPINALSI